MILQKQCCKSSNRMSEERARRMHEHPAELRIYTFAGFDGPLNLTMAVDAAVSLETRFHRGDCAQRIKDRCIRWNLHIEIDQAVYQNAADSKKRGQSHRAIQV